MIPPLLPTSARYLQPQHSQRLAKNTPAQFGGKLYNSLDHRPVNSYYFAVHYDEYEPDPKNPEKLRSVLNEDELRERGKTLYEVLKKVLPAQLIDTRQVNVGLARDSWMVANDIEGFSPVTLGIRGYVVSHLPKQNMVLVRYDGIAMGPNQEFERQLKEMLMNRFRRSFDWYNFFHIHKEEYDNIRAIDFKKMIVTDDETRQYLMSRTSPPIPEGAPRKKHYH